MQDIASRYFDYLSDLVVITGTDKDDHFEIIREDGATTIAVSRIKDGKVTAPYNEYTVSDANTDQIWVYGLDDDDTFRVSGKGKKPTPLRIIGGQNNDVYTIEDGRKVKVYEHKTKPNTVAEKGGILRKTNNYSYNTYNINKTLKRVNTVIPSLGFNPDDGLRIGFQDSYTVSSFKDEPYSSKHVFKAGFSTASSGFDGGYVGTFINTVGRWDLNIDARYTSDSFARNFFGIGNDTENFESELEESDDVTFLGLTDFDDLDLDFNRVRNRNLALKIGLVRDNRFGSVFSISAIVENVRIEETSNRFLAIPGVNAALLATNPEIFESQTFLGSEASYDYTSTDNAANPTRGMIFGLTVGGKLNVDDSDRTYGYLQPKLAFYNAITRNRKLVLKTQVQGQYNTGTILEDFDFFQAATLGANTGLRGFRNERFSGESSFVGSADLRYSFRRSRTGLLPIQVGIFGGFDVGRVWTSGIGESDRWHNDYGGGLWINAVDVISNQIGVFNSDDGLRVSFTFGVRL